MKSMERAVRPREISRTENLRSGVLRVLKDHGWSGEGSGAPGEIERHVGTDYGGPWSLQGLASYSEEFRTSGGGLRAAGQRHLTFEKDPSG